MGDVGCFSFYPGKNLGAFGDGGAVVTNNTDVNEKIRWWRSWGAKKKYHHELKGGVWSVLFLLLQHLALMYVYSPGNSRLDAIQAAVLGAKLKHIDAWNEKRRGLADRYSFLLEKMDGVHITCPKSKDTVEAVWHLYVIRLHG